MDRCPRCGIELLNDSCSQAACVQIELAIEQLELAHA